MPKTIEYSGISFRRISDKTTRKDILTRFGKVELTRARYRKGRDGETIFPIEKLLGIERGFTPAAADMAGKRISGDRTLYRYLVIQTMR